MLERWLVRASAPLSLATLIRLSGERVYRPMYHTVQGEQALPHVEHLYTPVSRARFTADLDAMLRHFEPVGLDELPAALAGGRRGRRPAMFLTFDDGLREVHDVALPILRARGIPATVFVNSAFVGNRGLFFRYLASALIAHGRRRPPEGATVAELARLLGVSAAAGTSGDWREWLLGVRYAERHRLDAAATVLEFDVDEFLTVQRPYMDIAEMLRLRDDGFTIGAHSVDHPLYRELSLDRQLDQTRESCEYVSATFDQSESSFAFPFSDAGVSAAFFERVREQGIASLAFGGQGYRREAHATTVQRHSMEGRDGDIEAQMRGDHLMSLARRASGRYRVVRE